MGDQKWKKADAAARRALRERGLQEADIDDIAQGAVVEVWRAERDAASTTKSSSPGTGWRAVRRAFDLFRRKSKTERLKERLARYQARGLAHPSPEHELAAEEMLHRIQQAWRALPVEHQVAFWWRYIEGREFADIAAELGVTEQKARDLVRVAERRLARAAAGEGT